MTIKKVELHTHLEGTIPPWLAKKLAKRNGITLPSALFTDDQNGYQYTDFLDFLKTYDNVAQVIKAPEDYYDITFDYLKMNAESDCIYTEMMYSPDHAEQSSGIPSGEHLAAIQQAIDEAEKQFGIMGRIIITAVRHFGVEAVKKVAKQATKEKAPCIVGFGLGGDEVNFPPQLFIEAYQMAHAAGLHCTVHAGEFAPANTMLDAMAALPVKRLGHGVQAIHSPETLAQIKDNNIALEVCPSSNIALGLFNDLSSHPFDDFFKAGITVSLGSDDPPFFKTNLGKEYDRVQRAYQYSEEQMKQITLMAIEASFADEKTKGRLRSQL